MFISYFFNTGGRYQLSDTIQVNNYYNYFKKYYN